MRPKSSARANEADGDALWMRPGESSVDSLVKVAGDQSNEQIGIDHIIPPIPGLSRKGMSPLSIERMEKSDLEE